MKTRITFLLITLGVWSIALAQYDTSTPQKFIESLGKVGSGPASENPIPFFYEQKSSDAISKYDAIGAKALANFQKFKSALLKEYGFRVANLEEDKIAMYVDPDRTVKLSFSLSGSLIGPQLKERSPEDYEFISATLPNDEQVVTISAKMLGEVSSIEVKKFGTAYKMFMDDENLAAVTNFTNVFEQMNGLLEGWLKFMNDKKLNDDNFESVITKWNNEYMEVLSLLN